VDQKLCEIVIDNFKKLLKIGVNVSSQVADADIVDFPDSP